MKKKLLFINGHLNAGGVERSLVDVLKHFDYERYQVDLLLLEEKGDYISEVPTEVNIHFYPLSNAYGPLIGTIWESIKSHDWFSFRFRINLLLSSKLGTKYLKYSQKLFKTLEPEYDAIIAYRPGICTDLATYAFTSHNKISWWHHGEMNFEGTALHHLGESYAHINHIVAVSNSSAELVNDAFPQIAERICVIPNMIDSEELKKKAKEYCVELDPSILNIVSVGRMSPEKNMIICPDVALKLKSLGVKFKWYIIGDGVDFDSVKQKIQMFGLDKELVLTGRLSNPYPYIKAASVMAHPALVESQGITLLESMALGTPVIAVASAGPKEFIKSGKNGILVENSIDGIVEKVCYYVERRDELDELRENAYKTVYSFDQNEILKKIYELLEM